LRATLVHGHGFDADYGGQRLGRIENFETSTLAFFEAPLCQLVHGAALCRQW